MLVDLDEVDWGALSHAYGSATAVPGLIRALSSSDADERREALDGLFTNIWHQGTVYEATAFAVPFLVELLANSSVDGKDEILRLLASIAQGSSFTDVHAPVFDRMGMSPVTEEARLNREVQLARELGWVRAACQAVEAGAWTYLELLGDDEPEVKIFAAYTLGQCRGRAAQIAAEVAARIPAEQDGRSRAALIMAIGSLEAAAGEHEEAHHVFTERLGLTECPVVRLASATCLARTSAVEPAPEVLDILTETTASAWNDFERLPWCEGDVAMSVGEALAAYPEARLRFLCGLLDSSDEAVRRGARYAVEKMCQQRRSVTALAAAALADRSVVGDLADRRDIVKILSRLGSAAALAVGPLSLALDDADAEVRSHAAVALARLRDPRAIRTLIALLGDDRCFTRVAEALGELGAAAAAAVPALLDVLARKPPRDLFLAHNRPIQVAEVLGQIGREAHPGIPALIALMKKHPHTQRAAAGAVGQIGGRVGRAAVTYLKRLLRSEDELVRIAAARSLWRIDRRADQILPVPIELLQAGRGNRRHAAEALGEMGEAAREAVPSLLACLQDRSLHARWMHLNAARALWRIERRQDRSLPVLANLLRECRPGGVLVATQAAVALGEMGAAARNAVPILRAAAEGDIRASGGGNHDVVIHDEAFCSAIAESLRLIEGDT